MCHLELGSSRIIFDQIVCVKKTYLVYGGLLAALLMLMRLIEYRFLVHQLSIEIYIGIVALLFTALGIWVGKKFTNRRKAPPSASPPAPPEQILAEIGISEREYEVLLLIAQGHSNQEIADQLFLSPNTVKTHISHLFTKLEVRRRTQAVVQAKSLGILP